jgi:hypothetical protein
MGLSFRTTTRKSLLCNCTNQVTIRTGSNGTAQAFKNHPTDIPTPTADANAALFRKVNCVDRFAELYLSNV